MDFHDWNACNDAILNTIIPAAKSTATISVAAWCMPKGYVGVDERAKISQASPEAQKSQAALAKFGTCYMYVPGPIRPGQDAKQETQAPLASGEPKLLGQCN